MQDSSSVSDEVTRYEQQERDCTAFATESPPEGSAQIDEVQRAKA
jgi:hypothetical protein